MKAICSCLCSIPRRSGPCGRRARPAQRRLLRKRCARHGRRMQRWSPSCPKPEAARHDRNPHRVDLSPFRFLRGQRNRLRACAADRAGHQGGTHDAARRPRLHLRLERFSRRAQTRWSAGTSLRGTVPGAQSPISASQSRRSSPPAPRRCGRHWTFWTSIPPISSYSPFTSTRAACAGSTSGSRSRSLTPMKR